MQDLIGELERRLSSETDDLVSQLEARLSAPAPAPAPRATPPVPTPAAVRMTGPLPSTPMASHTPAPPRNMLAVSHEPTPDTRPRVGPAPSTFDTVREKVRTFTRPFTQGLVGAPAEALAATGAATGLWSDDVRANVAQANRSQVVPAQQLKVFEDDSWMPNTDTLRTPAWWASVGGQAAGSIAGILTAAGAASRAVQGAGAALKLGPKALAVLERYGVLGSAASIESWLESGLGYSEAIESGATPDQAALTAAKQFAMNLPVTLAGNVPLFNPTTGRALIDALIAAGSEGAQEGAQQAAGNIAAQTYDPTRPVGQGVAEAAVVGGLAGGPASLALSRGRGPNDVATPHSGPAQPPITRSALGLGNPSRLATMEANAAAAIEALEQRVGPVEAMPVGDTPQSIPSVETDATVTPAVDATPVDAAAAIEAIEQRLDPVEDADELPPAVAPPTPAYAELLPYEQREIRRIAAELDNFGYMDGRMQKIPYWEPDTNDAKVVQRMPNASVLHPINRGRKRTGGDVRRAAERYIAGKGKPTTVTADILRIARKRAAGYEVKGAWTLPPSAGEEPGRVYVTPRRTGKPDAEREIETIRRLDREAQGLREAYVAKFGRVFNADNASEVLGPHEEGKRWVYHDAVRSSAGAMTQALFSDAMADPVDRDRNVVVLTGGGTGSGKSSALDRLQPDTDAVLDTTLADYDASKRNIELARRAGRSVVIDFTYRDPVDAFTGGVLRRLVDPENGRPVTTFTHASTHVNAPKTVLQLAEDYADDFDVAILVNENRTGAEPVARDLDWLREQAARYDDRDALRAQLEDALAAEVDAGRVRPEQARQISQAARFRETPSAAPDGRAQRTVPAAQRPQQVDRDSSTQGEPITQQNAEYDPIAELTKRVGRQASTGSPTRQLYVPQSATPVTGATTGVRPLSEQETVNRLREVFAVDRVTPAWLKMVVGTARTTYPTRVGKVSRNTFGHYQLDSGLIRLKKAFDLPTMAHELGHMISFRMFGRTPPTGLFKDEIMRLGVPTTPPKKLGTRYNFEEGIAEYFRIWFADPTKAHADAPLFTRALEDWMQEHPTAAAQLLAAQTVVRRYNQQPSLVRGRARVNVRPLGLKGKAQDVLAEMAGTTGGFVQRFAQAVKDTGNLPAMLRDPHTWFDKLMSHWVDRHTAIKRAVIDMAAGAGGKVAIENNAYVLTRLADGAAGMAEGFLMHGPRGLDGQFTAPSLKAALSPIRHRLYPLPGRTVPDFATYLVALRATELHNDGKGRWPGLAPEEARAIIAQTHADPEADLFKQSARRVYDYLKGIRQYALDYGLVSPEMDAKLGESLFYVPLQRVMDAAGQRLSGAARIANRESPIKRLKGSGRDIIDPIESIIKNTETMVNAVEKNRAAVALVKQARKSKHSADWLVPIPTPQVATQFNLTQVAKSIEAELDLLGIQLPMTQGGPAPFDRIVTAFLPATFGNPGDRVITVSENGKRRFYQVQDEALYQNITNVGIAPTSAIVRVAATGTSVLRAGATLRPSFILRNLKRDTVGAMMQSRHGFVPIYDSLRGLVSQMSHTIAGAAIGLTPDPAYRQFVAFGVQSASLLGQDRDRIRGFIDKMNQPSSLRANVLRVTKPIELLRWISEQVEVSTRLGEFKIALEAGGKERRGGILGIAQRLVDTTKGSTPITERSLTTAALAARDVSIDFARGGTTAKELSQFKAFFNARVQGYVRIAETFRRDPTGATLTMGALAVLSAALWSLNQDDEEYQELLPHEKRDYWWIRSPIGKGWARVAKPFEWALVPNMVEAALDNNLDVVDIIPVGDAYDLVWQLTPTLLLPFVEAAANHSSFTRRSIVSQYDAELDPDLQVREHTSDTARVAAYPLGVSPAKLEHIVYGFGGGLARDAVGIVDPASRLIAGRGKPPAPQPPITRSVPGLAAIYKEGGYDSSSKSIQDFYNEHNAYTKTVASLRQRAGGEGLGSYPQAYLDALDRFPDATAVPSGGEARLVVRRLDAGKKKIDALRDDLAAVRGSQTMTPPQKTTEIRAIHEAMVAVAREALGRTPLTRTRPTRREAMAQ